MQVGPPEAKRCNQQSSQSVGGNQITSLGEIGARSQRSCVGGYRKDEVGGTMSTLNKIIY